MVNPWCVLTHCYIKIRSPLWFWLKHCLFRYTSDCSNVHRVKLRLGHCLKRNLVNDTEQNCNQRNRYWKAIKYPRKWLLCCFIIHSIDLAILFKHIMSQQTLKSLDLEVVFCLFFDKCFCVFWQLFQHRTLTFILPTRSSDKISSWIHL